MPLLCLAVAGLMLVMNGWVCPGLGLGLGLDLLAVRGYLLWRRTRTCWHQEPPEAPVRQRRRPGAKSTG